ncbi:sugar ABC transporter permease [Allorhizobium borbori]|uniref:Xylose transport system permease protein XylH n=1 Tax=Allorhizobium borbori TaxID=485907 RepID=A0A7W6K5B6_9HYPH|nr:sugar ABC transporter permease [Allorhizobium borbori]MBB4105465.1 D-xylose transport system permease protein [Allorhizobium borbori]
MTTTGGKSFRKFLSENKIVALLVVVALIWALFGILTYDADTGTSGFLTARNFSNLLRQMAITGMLAAAMVFVIVAGEIDLSVGSLLGLLGGVAAILDVVLGWPLAGTIATVLLLGAVLGLFNGWLTAYLGIPSFIVTLGGQLAFRGAVLGLTGGITISPVSPGFKYLGQGYLPGWLGNACAIGLFVLLVAMALLTRGKRTKHNLPVATPVAEVARLAAIGALVLGFVLVLNSYQGIPVPVLVLLVVLGLFTVMAKGTVFGRYVYAVGSNAEATRLSGVNVNLVKMLVFGLMGLMAAFAGLATTARLAAGTPSAGFGGELDAIASCFIGGTSMRGGVGSVIGALVGALIMASLDNGMSMLGVDTFWQQIIKGMILVLAVYLDIVSSGNKRA